jgi:hypothetical protein
VLPALATGPNFGQGGSEAMKTLSILLVVVLVVAGSVLPLLTAKAATAWIDWDPVGPPKAEVTGPQTGWINWDPPKANVVQPGIGI